MSIPFPGFHHVNWLPNMSIPSPGFHHVKAAQGWLELGNYEEAISDLGKVDGKLHDHPDVLKVLWETISHYPKGINQWCEQGSSKETLRALKSIEPELSMYPFCRYLSDYEDLVNDEYIIDEWCDPSQ